MQLPRRRAGNVRPSRHGRRAGCIGPAAVSDDCYAAPPQSPINWHRAAKHYAMQNWSRLKLRSCRRAGTRLLSLQTADLHSGEQKTKTDDPWPVADICSYSNHAEVSKQCDDVQNETDEPCDLLWSFTRASCHEGLLCCQWSSLYSRWYARRAPFLACRFEPSYAAGSPKLALCASCKARRNRSRPLKRNALKGLKREMLTRY